MISDPTHVHLPPPQFQSPDRRARLLDACPRLESIFRSYADSEHMPGVAYGVIVDGELIFTHSFGVRDVASGAPLDADTVFRIASMTKSFAATAILLLRDAGMLRLDEPAATYVPELASLRYPTADAPAITVRHLLTMSAGLPQDDPWADRQFYRSDAAMSDIYRGGVSFSNPPGITFEYSNYGYMVLGRIISRVAGVPALDFIDRAILQPLGMTATVWNAAAVPPDRLAQGYRWEDDAWREEPLLPSGGDVAAFAGLFSSVRDLARWVGFFQSAWPARDEAGAGVLRRSSLERSSLERSSLREMQQAWRMDSPSVRYPGPGREATVSSGGYGYGLFSAIQGGRENVGHGGGLPGFGSHMRWAPAHGVGVVALANVTYADVHAASDDALEELLRASQVQPRTPQPAPALTSARAGILRLLHAWDDALADGLFADNFFLDLDRARWQRRLEQLRERHGALRPDGPLEAENWLRGRWHMAGERGGCWVWISLAPTLPPLVQDMEIESTLPPSPALAAAAERLAGLTAHPTRRGLARLFTAKAGFDALWDRVRLAAILCGPCTVGEVLGGDGATWATFRFIGPKGNADVELHMDGRGKLSDAIFRLAAAR